MVNYVYKARCTRVVDGDTLELDVDLGFNVALTIRGRLLGVDAPELFSGTDRENGKLAKLFLENLVLNKDLLVNTYKDKTTFGRWLVEVKYVSGENINVLAENYCKTLRGE